MVTEQTGQHQTYDAILKFYLDLIASLTEKIGEAEEGGAFLDSLKEKLETIAAEMVNRWQDFRSDTKLRAIDLISLQYRRAIGLVANQSQKHPRIESVLCANDVDLRNAADDPKHPYRGASPYSNWALAIPLRLRMYSGDHPNPDEDDPPKVATLTMSIARLEKSWMWLALQLGLVDQRVIHDHAPGLGRFTLRKQAIEELFDHIGDDLKWVIIQEYFKLMRDQAQRDRHEPPLAEEILWLLTDSNSQVKDAFRHFPKESDLDPNSPKSRALRTALTSTQRTYRLYRYERQRQPREWERNLLYTTVHIQDEIVGGSVLYSRRIPSSGDLLVSSAVTRLAIYRLRAVEEDVARKLFYQARARHQATKFHQYQIAHDLRKLVTGIAWALEDLPMRAELPADAKAALDRVRGEVLRVVDMTQTSIDADAKALRNYAWDSAQDDRLDEFVKDSLWLPEMVARRRRPAITFKLDLDAARVRIPRTFVSEVLENLVSNAVDHAKAERLVIKVAAKVLPSGNCWFEVSDNGEGEGDPLDFDSIGEQEFPEESADVTESAKRDPSVQSNPRRGVGLKLTHYIVNDILGGRIGDEKVPGVGTRVWFEIGGSHDDRTDDASR